MLYHFKIREGGNVVSEDPVLILIDIDTKLDFDG